MEIQSAFCLLLIVTTLEVYRLRKVNDPESRYILGGILLAVAAVAVHGLKWSFGPWFTFFDIGHVFLCGTMWMIMRGAEAGVQRETA
ncbi:MAG: light-harvesting protein [Saprospiraceae bacterium]|nr:light-harvesting protein [Saprospiraceae bacterium]